MRIAPEDVAERDLIFSVFQGWGLRLIDAAYLPVGFGSHHWLAADDTGARHWITVDELAEKGYLGANRDAAFEGLRRAFDTAVALRDSGLEFVLAPTPTAAGETVRRLGAGHTVAVFPYVEGVAHQFGAQLPSAEADQRVEMLVRLHHATVAAASTPRTTDVRLADRSHLESALRDLDRPWTGGPFAEPARTLLARNTEGIGRLLEAFDRLADRVAAAGAEAVITHGEPHPGNLVTVGGSLVLVDWDTIGFALPERDLWMLDGRDQLARYAELSDRPVDEHAISLYRLRWQLDDLSTLVRWFRSEHQRTVDTEQAWCAFAETVEAAQRWHQA